MKIILLMSCFHLISCVKTDVYTDSTMNFVSKEMKDFELNGKKFVIHRFKFDDDYHIMLTCSEHFPIRSVNLHIGNQKCYVASHRLDDNLKSIDELENAIVETQLFKILLFASEDQVLDFKECETRNNFKNEMLLTIIYGKKAVVTINQKNQQGEIVFSINNYKPDYSKLTCQDSEFINHSGWEKMRDRWPIMLKEFPTSYSSLQFYQDN